MENQPLSVPKFSTSYGLILGVILITISVLMYVTGMVYDGAQWPMYIYYLIFPVFIGYVIYSYRNANYNYLTLAQALKVGVTTAVISALVYMVYNLIFIYFIEPDFASQMLDLAREKMLEQNPQMTQEQIDMSMKMIENFSNPWFGSAFFIIMSAFFGFVYSLIAGLIFKRERV